MIVDGSLVVTDSTAQATCKIVAHPAGSALFQVKKGSFTMAAGTLDMTPVSASNSGAAFNVKGDANGAAYMQGGTVLGIVKCSAGTLTMTGGTVDKVVSKNGGAISIEGGTVNGAIYYEQAGGTITIPAQVNNELNPTQFGTNEWNGVEYTTFLSPATGYTIAKGEGAEWFMVTASGSSGTELEPGQQDATQYETRAEAEAAAANVTIVASDAVTNALDAAAQATYLANFETKVVAVTGGSGSYAVVVDLKDTSVSNLQEQVNADVAAVVPALGESTVTVSATPGFYYSVSRVGSLPGDFAAGEGDRVLATGSTVELPMPVEPLGATAGFYKVMVNIAPKATQQSGGQD